MKAIILAAGEGKRLRPLTSDKPKCMAPFRGRPLIAWGTDALRSAGITDIVAVTGYCAPALDCDGVRTVHNPRFAETNMVYSLFCAASELTGDLIISYSDIIYTPQVVEALLAAKGNVCVVVDKAWEALWRMRMENPLDDAESLILDPSGSIIEIGKKTADPKRIQGQYIGLIKIASGAISEVRSFYNSLDRNALYDGKSFENMYMTSFIQAIADRLFPVTAVPIAGNWLEVDSVADLEAYGKCDYYPGKPLPTV